MANEYELASSFIPSLHKLPSLLPIARHREDLLYLIETFPVTIVIGQTGSGKTTQIPQFLEQAGWCAEGTVLAVTQVCKFEHVDLILRGLNIDGMTASACGRDYGCNQSGRGDGLQAG